MTRKRLKKLYISSNPKKGSPQFCFHLLDKRGHYGWILFATLGAVVEERSRGSRLIYFWDTCPSSEFKGQRWQGGAVLPPVAEVAPGYSRLQSSLTCSWEVNQRISGFSQTSDTRYLFKNNSWWEQDSCSTHLDKTGLLTRLIMSCASAAEVW